jgi:hypothetical protein
MPTSGSATRLLLVAETVLRDGATPIYNELANAWQAEGRCVPGRPDPLRELLAIVRGSTEPAAPGP